MRFDPVDPDPQQPKSPAPHPTDPADDQGGAFAPENGNFEKAEGQRPGSGRPRRQILIPLVMLALVAFLVLAARWTTDPDARMLVVDEEGAVSLVDGTTGETAYTLSGAVPTPDRSTLLTAWPDGGDTILSTRDAANGAVTGRTTLPGNLSIRTVSPEGGAVALLAGDAGGDLYLPEPRSSTSLTVAYTDDRPSQTYDLPGNIEPEMFSLAEDALFVLSFDPPMEPTGYTVQRLDLGTGELSDTASPQVGLNPKMAGKARAQAMHPDGTFLYTLYTLTDGPIQDPTAATDGQGGEDRWAFIHVINLDEQWSYCIFLERPVGTGDEAGIGLTIAPDGQTLYVADSSTSTLTEVDPIGLTAQAPRPVPELDSNDRAEISVAPDGTIYLATGAFVKAFDPVALDLTDAWAFASDVDGLAVQGDELRAAVDGEVTLINRLTGRETGVLQAPRNGQLRLLGPPAGNATNFPVECVC